MADEDNNEVEEAEDELDYDEDEESSREPVQVSQAVGAGTRTLGIERWVQFGFIALFGICFWIFGKVVEIVWDQFAEPQQVPVAATAFLVAMLTTYLLYKHEKVNSFSNEAASELSKVTWPTRKETWSNTVVVVITSMIAAAILFGFDAAWSWVTDLIYKG